LAQSHELAEGYCRQGIDLSRRLGVYASSEAYLLGMLGDSYTGRGRYQEGIETFSRAMELFQIHGYRRGEALCLLKQGQAYLALGREQQAARFLQRCFPIFQELGMPAYEDAAIRALEECRPTLR
jgi:tetratricopeptide (TPR) repeat protein